MFKHLIVGVLAFSGLSSICLAQDTPPADTEFTADERKIYFEGPNTVRRSSLETGISLHSTKARIAAMRNNKEEMATEVGKAVELRFELAKLYMTGVDKPDFAQGVLRDLTDFYGKKSSQDSAIQVVQLASEQMVKGQILQIAQFQEIINQNQQLIKQNEVVQQQNRELFVLNERLLRALEDLAKKPQLKEEKSASKNPIKAK